MWHVSWVSFLTDGSLALKLCYITCFLWWHCLRGRGNPVYLPHVFHSIRFKVNKVGVRRYSFFYVLTRIVFRHFVFKQCFLFPVWLHGSSLLWGGYLRPVVGKVSSGRAGNLFHAGNFFIFRLEMHILSLRMYIFSLRMHILRLKMKFPAGQIEVSTRLGGVCCPCGAGRFCGCLSEAETQVNAELPWLSFLDEAVAQRFKVEGGVLFA